MLILSGVDFSCLWLRFSCWKPSSHWIFFSIFFILKYFDISLLSRFPSSVSLLLRFSVQMFLTIIQIYFYYHYDIYIILHCWDVRIFIHNRLQTRLMVYFYPVIPSTSSPRLVSFCTLLNFGNIIFSCSESLDVSVCLHRLC